MYRRTLLQSFRLALDGILFVVRNERNMKIHLVFGAAAVALCLFLKVTPIEFIFIVFSIALVLIAETANTAFELLLDFVHGDRYHPDVKLLKDIVAGGVFIASANAFVIGVIVFGSRLLHLTMDLCRF
ncbi:MAG: diacylglycerol kinase family protein [Candidatus Omnitrophota bacterium]|jgi:diacylglycerol kinase|nr:diacylglycerol kinase family protein [Candidatus Omnitrophota bacterium]MDD5137451.1 diacylglycerol kinase family protein [Candidatus Omnitrophota bacterium]MDD5538545.1 diacylglycerol kinase family protein [Candidatus Omnitrophota bacterium]